MGMTLREFAKEIDVGFSTISQWENGTYPIPGPMVKLMDFYEEKLAKNNEKPKSTGISGKLPGNKSHDNG
jgi:transcriptional regulator with XRE-family HTH domain